ncbi:MAG: sigma 54-interacting transcriptional regulator [Geobacter sp.]|nr:sigma 54-interacting transcriptional regulator [Geobacter sp.]
MVQIRHQHRDLHNSEILDSIADSIFTVDNSMYITSYNRAAELLTGIMRNDAIGRQCHQIFRTAVCFNNCPVREALEKDTIINREIIIHDQRGELLPVWVTSSALHDEHGNVIGGVESMRNLRRIYSIIDSVADGLFTVNNDMHITNFNKAAEELTGFSHDEAIGRPCSEIFRSHSCNGDCPLREALTTRQPIQRDIEITARSGRKIQLSVKSSTLFDCSGAPIGGIETLRDMTPIMAIKEEIQQRYTFKAIISRNVAMLRLFDVMEDIAVSDATVFLNGESGTGKELFAHALHDLSYRQKKPMITVNCGALPETLLESEIFGVRKGAFTGATENRQGRLQLCEGGTFFLDEIGDLPMQLQVKLLRVLENHEFQPLGAPHPIKANVRFITATNRNLEEMVEKGTFRKDLYFRINIITLNIPPLRDRRDDIPLLIDMALKRFNFTYHKKIQSVSPEVMTLLLHHPFHGNVRELLNILEQAVIMCRTHQITLDHLPEAFKMCNIAAASTTNQHHSKRGIDEETLHALLSKFKGNRNEIAHALGVDRTTLWRWMKRYGMSSHLEEYS